MSCWNAGRGSVCGVPFPGWEDWVREGRVLLFEGDLEELRSGPARGAGSGGVAVCPVGVVPVVAGAVVGAVWACIMARYACSASLKTVGMESAFEA